MEKVYLDNASTTAIRPEVISEMAAVMGGIYGNPSSTHSFGRSAKVVLEISRKTIAGLLNAEAREIIFTSGGTEGINLIIRSAVRDLKVQRIITSRIEHHAVLNTALAMKAEYGTAVNFVNLNANGSIDFSHLELLLKEDVPTLVSLMHVNNETGHVLDIAAVGNLCREYKAFFHSDTVQSVGKTGIDLQNLPVDFITASAHKFHGPKGTGFIYIRKNITLHPVIYGGEQEKGVRAGTEAVHQVAGMAKALQLSYQNLEMEQKHISDLKSYLLEKLDACLPGYSINGAGSEPDKLFYNILNVLLPLPEEKTAMILFHLDMKGVAVSRGSACQSGSIKPSHVLKEILNESDIKKPSLRISFSHYNTRQDIDVLVDALKTI
jgi:cysteine desulfurase